MANEAVRNGVAPTVGCLRVFVVENHEDTRTLLCILLESLGHTALSSTTMDEALRQLPDADCDVLISDIGLPDGDGWQLMERLRLTRPIYAVAMSGYGMTADRARSRAAGFRHHLVKPYGIEDLPRILGEAARERAMRAPPACVIRKRRIRLNASSLRPDWFSGQPPGSALQNLQNVMIGPERRLVCRTAPPNGAGRQPTGDRA